MMWEKHGENEGVSTFVIISLSDPHNHRPSITLLIIEAGFIALSPVAVVKRGRESKICFSAILTKWNYDSLFLLPFFFFLQMQTGRWRHGCCQKVQNKVVMNVRWASLKRALPRIRVRALARVRAVFVDCSRTCVGVGSNQPASLLV